MYSLTKSLKALSSKDSVSAVKSFQCRLSIPAGIPPALSDAVAKALKDEAEWKKKTEEKPKTPIETKSKDSKKKIKAKKNIWSFNWRTRDFCVKKQFLLFSKLLLPLNEYCQIGVRIATI